MLVPVLVLGAGCRRWCCELFVRALVETRCRCWVLAVRVVEPAGAGAGAGCSVLVPAK